MTSSWAIVFFALSLCLWSLLGAAVPVFQGLLCMLLASSLARRAGCALVIFWAVSRNFVSSSWFGLFQETSCTRHSLGCFKKLCVLVIVWAVSWNFVRSSSLVLLHETLLVLLQETYLLLVLIQEVPCVYRQYFVYIIEPDLNCRRGVITG